MNGKLEIHEIGNIFEIESRTVAPKSVQPLSNYSIRVQLPNERTHRCVLKYIGPIESSNSFGPFLLRSNRKSKETDLLDMLWFQLANPSLIREGVRGLFIENEPAFWNLVLTRAKYGTVLPMSDSFEERNRDFEFMDSYDHIHRNTGNVWDEFFDQIERSFLEGDSFNMDLSDIQHPLNRQIKYCQCGKQMNSNESNFCSRTCFRKSLKYYSKQ